MPHRWCCCTGIWRRRRCGGPTSPISARTIASTPSMSWVNPARAFRKNRYEMRQITPRGWPRRWTDCTSTASLSWACRTARGSPSTSRLPHRERVQKLVLLSPGGGFIPMVKQFSLRGMLMVLLPTRVTVNSFMRWLGFTERSGETDARSVLELMYLGLKHFRMPPETLRVMPTLFSDDQLRAMRVPTLLLIGDREVICDPAAALARARGLFPDVQGALVPRSSHDMCFSQHRIVDARVLAFLKQARTKVGVRRLPVSRGRRLWSPACRSRSPGTSWSLNAC